MKTSFDKTKFKSLQTSLNSHYESPRLLITGSDGIPVVPVCSIQDPVLDTLLGGGNASDGGLMMNSFVELSGGYSSGKTTLALEWISIFAKKFPDRAVAFIDAEAAFDRRYAAHIGVPINSESFTYSIPDEGKQAMTILKTLLQSGMYSLIVIDSIAALQPPMSESDDREVGDNQIGAHAKMMAETLREVKPYARLNETTVIMINQERTNLTRMGAFGKITTGGNAVSFFADCRINIQKAGKDSTERIVKIEKSKYQAIPHTECSIHIKHGVGLDRLESLISLAIGSGLIKTGGAGWLTVMENDKFQGRQKLTDALFSNKELRDKLCEKLNIDSIEPRAKKEVSKVIEQGQLEEEEKTKVKGKEK